MRRTSVVVLAAVLAVALPARLARAAPPVRPLAESLGGDAKRDYQAGKLLASDGDYAGALLKFQSAYEASRDPRLLWDMAFCEKSLRHYARVLALLKRYEAGGGALLSARDLKDARDLEAALEPFTTTLRVTVDQDGAEVFVDDESVGVSPLASSRVVDIGTHRIRATKAGFHEAAVLVPVGGGVDVPVALHLEREVHEGRIVVHAPAAATIVLDGEPAGAGSLDRTVPTGGHQLVVRAPGMRPFHSEVVVADRETRSLDVMLEKTPDQELPRIQVAVGCVDGRPRSAADGLAVYLDGAPLAASPIEVRTRRDPESKSDVVAWVAYPANPGPHEVELRVPGCVPAQLEVNVLDPGGARVEGALPPVRETLSEGTAGSPEGWRVGAGVWYGSLVQHDLYADIFSGQSIGTPAHPEGISLPAVGPSVEGGWVRRWFTVQGEARMAWASTTGTTIGVKTPETFASFGSLSTASSLTAYRFGVRAGPRLPFGTLALSAGATGAIGVEHVVASEWSSNVTHTGVLGGVWASLDVKVMCDWGASGTFEDDLATTMGVRSFGGVFVVGYEPNSRCRGERTTRYGVEEGAR